MPTPIDPQYYARKVEIAPWPEKDPAPEVTTLDPRPTGVKLPSSVALLACEVDGTRVGYSRALLRGVELGTYRLTEAWSLWFPPGALPLRPFASYERFVDKRAQVKWNGKELVSHVPPAGPPGTWKWARVSIGRHPCNVTELKQYLAVSGSVLPSWFESVADRIATQAEKTKAAARNRTTVKENAG